MEQVEDAICKKFFALARYAKFVQGSEGRLALVEFNKVLLQIQLDRFEI